MDGGRVYGGSHDMIALLKNPSNSLWVSPSSPSFHEVMVNFDQEAQEGGRPSPKRDRHGRPVSRTSDDEDTGGEELEINDYHYHHHHHHPGKKRRLTHEQVQFLEKNFEVENKLEPERKVELAQRLGLQPRQVAIWFQNRRARFKTKQLEKEFDSLKANYDRLKLDFDSLSLEKEALQNEVKLLTKKLAQRGEEKENNPNITKGMPEITETKASQKPNIIKQVEDASSAKSDVIDSDSPHYTDGNQSSGSGSGLVEDQHSDFSQDDEQHLMMMMSKSLLLPSTPPTFNSFMLKVEDDGTSDGVNGSSCNFSPVDEQPFWPWLYYN